MLSLDSAAGQHPDLNRQEIDYPGNRYRIVQTWPETVSGDVANVPDNIASFYTQANESLRAHRWDAAGAMYRKTLDVATKLVSDDLRNLSLFKRIEELVRRNLLTPAMGEWAHEIRLDGNDAVHDDLPETQEDAQASQKFTEAFLTYAFTLPVLVASNRAKRE